MRHHNDTHHNEVHNRFNSRTPCGVRPNRQHHYVFVSWFQFTHPVWGATSDLASDANLTVVSIHAPRVGCDIVEITIIIDKQVSIHAPRVGCDQNLATYDCCTYLFQFTHPVWGATPLHRQTLTTLTVSIHAPRVGCDMRVIIGEVKRSRFNSRTPCGVRQHVSVYVRVLGRVSIHAPRVGCDGVRNFTECVTNSFNSRTPCGVRHEKVATERNETEFQFTHPVWGATQWNRTLYMQDKMFQFTHPVWGATTTLYPATL